MLKPLTKKQVETLTFIKKFFSKHGYMPSHQDISKKFKIKIGGSTKHRFDSLVKNGHITKLKNRPRYITLNKVYLDDKFGDI